MFLKLKYTDITKNTKLNGYGDKGERKVWSSCSSTYCICFAWRITRTLRMFVIQSTAAQARSRCYCTREVLGTLRTTAILVRVFM